MFGLGRIPGPTRQDPIEIKGGSGMTSRKQREQKRSDTAVLQLSESNNGNGKNGTVRMTIILPENLDWNLTVWCANTGESKSELIQRVVHDFLVAQGLQPDRRPARVAVSY